MTDIHRHNNVWFPGVYAPREGDYAETIAETMINRAIELVQQRIKEDGEWAIENNFVGDNEDKMRKMIAWASKEENIWQCIKHIGKEGEAGIRTVDWVCRDMANAAKVIGGGNR